MGSTQWMYLQWVYILRPRFFWMRHAWQLTSFSRKTDWKVKGSHRRYFQSLKIRIYNLKLSQVEFEFLESGFFLWRKDEFQVLCKFLLVCVEHRIVVLEQIRPDILRLESLQRLNWGLCWAKQHDSAVGVYGGRIVPCFRLPVGFQEILSSIYVYPIAL